MRLIDLEMRTRTVWISCPYDPRVIATIKTIPGREFDKRTKRWSAPMSSIAAVVERLEPLRFRFTPRMRDWWLEHRDDDAIPGPTGTADPAGDFDVDPADGYTVSRLNEEARRALAESFGGDVWLVAELDGFDRNKADGHAYFELIERVAAGGDAIARIGAVMFANTRRRIQRELGDALTLSDGIVVRVRGKVDIYAPSGRFQFIVEEVDADWSIGAMRRRRDQVLKKLEEQGLLDRNRSLPTPRCPLRVGVVTSLESDAYNDFVDELRRSEFAFDVTVHDARMQGRDTAASVTAALAWFAARRDEFDVIVVTRGGGSRSDLSYFDSMEIGEAVCRHPVKVIAGIGHHRDESVLDFVAHSEKTPTAAAQRLVELVSASLDRVDREAERLAELSARLTDRATRHIDDGANRLQRNVMRRMRDAERRVDRAANRAVRGGRDLLSQKANSLDAAVRDIERAALERTRRATRRTDRASARLDPASFERRALRHRAHVDELARRLTAAADAAVESTVVRLDHLESTVHLSDPRRILERGFALVRDPDGRIVTRADEVRELSHARLQMRDGEVDVEPREDAEE